MLEERHRDVESTSGLEEAPKIFPVAGRPSREPANPHASQLNHDAQHSASPVHLPPIHGPRHPPLEEMETAIAQLRRDWHYVGEMFDSHRAYMTRIEGAVDQLQMDMRNICSAFDNLRAEVSQLPNTQREHHDAGDLDFLLTQLQGVAAKANEVDGLKMQMEILTRRLRRVEEQGSPHAQGLALEHPQYSDSTPHGPTAQAAYGSNTPTTNSRGLTYQTPIDARLPPPALLQARDPGQPVDYPQTEESRTLPGFKAMDAASSWRPTAYSHGSPGPADTGHAPPSEPQPQQPPIGWAAVNNNANAKRSYESTMPGSPKRQRLATLMPRTSYDGQRSGSSAQSSLHPTATSTPDSALSMQQSRNTSYDSQPIPATASSAAPAATGPGPLRFVQYPTQPDLESQESWQAEAQRASADRSRGLDGGIGRTPGQGRERRSGPAEGEHDNGNGEWDRSDWYHVTGGGSASSPERERERYYGHEAGGYAVEGASALVPAPGGMGILFDDGSGGHGSSKKTRTKPIRNAEGVLIRKDGRPDMRSVSSAMNLRKVHAKKEAERGTTSAGSGAGQSEERDATAPGSPVDVKPVLASGIAVGELEGQREREQGRHRENMRMIFPFGVVPSGYEAVPGSTQQQQQQQPKTEAVAQTVEHDATEERRKQTDDVEMKDDPEAPTSAGADARVPVEEEKS